MLLETISLSNNERGAAFLQYGRLHASHDIFLQANKLIFALLKKDSKFEATYQAYNKQIQTCLVYKRVQF